MSQVVFLCVSIITIIILMAAVGEDLFSSGDISRWQAALLCYEQVVEVKAAGKTKKTAKSAETLVELDTWYAKNYYICVACIIKKTYSCRYQNTLPDLISSRDQPHLTHEELAKLMKWKLTVKFMHWGNIIITSDS